MENAGVGKEYRASLRAEKKMYEVPKPAKKKAVAPCYPQVAREPIRVCADTITHNAPSQNWRPAAVKRNGGLRGSTASRWK